MNNASISKELVHIARGLVAEGDDQQQQVVKDFESGLKGELSNVVSKEIGQRVVFYGTEYKRGHFYFFTKEWSGDNIGIMSLAIKSVSIYVVFSVGSPLEDGTYGGRIQMEWEHPSGGGNGLTLGHCWYNPITKSFTAKYHPN